MNDDCKKEAPMPEKPMMPYVQCSDDKRLPIMWGWGGKAFILALFLLLGTTSLFAYRVAAGEEADKKIEKNIKTLGENQEQLDEQARIQAAQTALTVKQLNKLLEIGGVTKRIEAPAVKKSELKELE